MGTPIPNTSYEDFERRLRGYLARAESHSLDLPPRTARDLYLHFQELRIWNPRLSLIGPGTAERAVERHYGESLLGLPLLEPADRVLLDLGTGAGFPGLPLGLARPGLEPWLVDSRQKKCAFLQSVARKASFSCRCLNARVGVPLPSDLPQGIDVVASRAVRIDPKLFQALFESHAGARCLLWRGKDPLELPAGAEIRRRVEIPDSERQILEVVSARSNVA